MKQDKALVTCQQWEPRQFIEAAWALLRRQRELKAWRATPTRKRRQADHATIPARITSLARRARVAALTLALLLCAVLGAVEAIATTHAAPANPLAGNAPIDKPTGTPGRGKPTPTPTASLSPTFTLTPSETPGPQPSGSAITQSTVPVPATTPHAREQPGENQMRVRQASVAGTSPTDSGKPPSPDQPGGVLRLLALVMAILGSSGCVVCLLALGLRRRKQRISLKAKQPISPAARNWQRARPESLDGETGIAGSGRVQTLPSAADCAPETSIAERTTEPSLPIVGDDPLSLSGFSLTTSQPTLATVQPPAPAWPPTAPTSAEALTGHIQTTPRAGGSIPRVPASAGPKAAKRKRREDRDTEHVPSLTDAGGEEALEEYIRKGRLAWQPRGRAQASD